MMSALQSILYGLASGIAEFLPVSARAHQALLRHLFGIPTRDSLQNLLVHIGVCVAIFVACRETISRLLREQKNITSSRRRISRSMDGKSRYELRLLKTAIIPFFLVMLLSFTTTGLESSFPALMVFLILNGIILLGAEHTSHGNRDASTMSGLDGIVMGIAGGASVLPGISRTGLVSVYTTLRGADSQNSANWAILLGIPAMFFAVFFDVCGLFAAGAAAVTFPYFISCLLSGLAAFCGGYMGISLFKLILNHSGFSGFAYYSFGAALFSFVLYLIG